MFLIAGCEHGILNIFNNKKKTKEMNQISEIETREKLSSFYYSPKTKELFTCSSNNGAIQVINSISGETFCINSNHIY